MSQGTWGVVVDNITPPKPVVKFSLRDKGEAASKTREIVCRSVRGVQTRTKNTQKLRTQSVSQPNHVILQACTAQLR